MITVPYNSLLKVLEEILSKTGFTSDESDLCAKIFADSTLDGYHSHGVNRFPVFLKTITDGYVQLGERPERQLALGNFERWDGKLGPGPLNAHFCMNRAIELAKESGMGCIALQNGSHWMRGGSYGWQAAEAGCIAMCFTNTMPNMPSYGKMEKYAMDGRKLPFDGGFDADGEPTNDPKAILETKRLFPTGYWKGSGMSILVDLLVTLLSSGKSTAKIGEMEAEYGLSQVFICFDAEQMNSSQRHKELVTEIIDFVTRATSEKEGQSIEYPGSQTKKRRATYMKEGIPINESVWEELSALL